MIVLVFGGPKTTPPSPIRASRATIIATEVSAVTVARENNPRLTSTTPAVAWWGEWVRSAIHPLRGEKTSSITVESNRPVSAVENPRTSMR